MSPIRIVIEPSCVTWYKDDKEHREDGPAKVYADGSEIWCLYGNNHRDDGPAYINADNGIKVWFKHGKQHREDGPAIEYPDGGKRWLLYGIEYSEKEFHEVIKCGYLHKNH